MSRNIVCIGATSAIAQAVLREFCSEAPVFALIGRSAERLDAVAVDLKGRGATNVAVHTADLVTSEGRRRLVEQLSVDLSQIDVLIMAQGQLPAGDAPCTVALVREAFEVNLLSVVELLAALMPLLEKARGTAAIISSVAGDRGRRSNYLYGAAKGGLSLFLEGLRPRARERGVSIVTVKPGFVDTPMTADFKKGALFAQPELVARDIVQAIAQRRATLYTPWFWRWIMLPFKVMPEWLLARLPI